EELDQITYVLSALFPSKAKLFLGPNASSNEPHGEVVKRRGIGSVAGYDAYFGLHPSPDAIPKKEIDELLGLREDEEAVVERLETFIGRKDRQGYPIIGQLLEELRFRFQGPNPAEPTQALLGALFRTGEQIFAIEQKGDLFELSPR